MQVDADRAGAQSGRGSVPGLRTHRELGLPRLGILSFSFRWLMTTTVATADPYAIAPTDSTVRIVVCVSRGRFSGGYGVLYRAQPSSIRDSSAPIPTDSTLEPQRSRQVVCREGDESGWEMGTNGDARSLATRKGRQDRHPFPHPPRLFFSPGDVWGRLSVSAAGRSSPRPKHERGRGGSPTLTVLSAASLTIRPAAHGS